MTKILWFDNSVDSLETKVERAAKHFLNKYGEPATVCHINPETLDGKKGGFSIGNIKIISNRNIRPNHFRIGTKNKQKQ